jgi:SAM-dependent methyltransferase
MNEFSELIPCPYCSRSEFTLWGIENKWSLVRCQSCNLLYCNPRPNRVARNKATELGVHECGDDLNISERRVGKKVKHYKIIFKRMFADVWSENKPISWIDIGAGYGEVVEAIMDIAPKGSLVCGLEPMRPKIVKAKLRGLNIIEGFIDENTPTFSHASLINVFSHVYDFDKLLREIKDILTDDGELYIETADIGDVSVRNDFPGELGMPDHVIFASEIHLKGFLERNGFYVLGIERARIDTIRHFIKSVVKKCIGRNVAISIPYLSPYRSIGIRAKKYTAHNLDQ